MWADCFEHNAPAAWLGRPVHHSKTSTVCGHRLTDGQRKRGVLSVGHINNDLLLLTAVFVVICSFLLSLHLEAPPLSSYSVFK